MVSLQLFLTVFASELSTNQQMRYCKLKHLLTLIFHLYFHCMPELFCYISNDIVDCRSIINGGLKYIEDDAFNATSLMDLTQLYVNN